MAKYEVIEGQFSCHECKEIVKTLRTYVDTGTLTWMCSKRHISRVELLKRSKL